MNSSNDSGGEVFLKAFFVFALLISGHVINASMNDDGSQGQNIAGQLFKKFNITRTDEDQ